MRKLGWILASALLLLAACGQQAPAPAERAPVAFETLEVTVVPSVSVRHLDEEFEAVSQATVSSQTAGRVLELPFDVNDYVEAGQVVVRFTDVEQVSALRGAAAALNAARADLA